MLRIALQNSWGWTRTNGLRVMSPTSCQLLYPASYLFLRYYYKNNKRSRAFCVQFGFFCKAISSQGGRLSSMQNCVAILQSIKKFMDGFFDGKSYAGLEGRGALPQGNGAGRRNPAKPVAKGLFGRIRGRVDGRAVTVIVHKI